jgi:hypothetical protein
MSGAFSYFYHPYFEGLIVPVWAYGALLGMGFGLTQSIGLRDRAALGTWWVLVTAVSAGLGLEVAVLVASAGGPVAYGAVLGGWVAAGQWLVLRNQIGRAGWRMMSSAIALAVGVLSCGIALNSTLRGMNPLPTDALAIIAAGGQEPGFQVMRRGLYAPVGWTELAVELGVLATTGLVIGMLTARPLSLALTPVDVE